MKNFFILIPALGDTGPIQGAIALANSLVKKRNVYLVSIKKSLYVPTNINKNIIQICLADKSASILCKIKAYKLLLRSTKTGIENISISMCFSADLLNIFCKQEAKICSSIRGNLIGIYKMDYGIWALPAAIIHFLALRRFDFLVAMSKPMAKQIKFFTGRSPEIIGNFLDEPPLVKYLKKRRSSKNGPIKFVFVGKLNERKKPILLVQAIQRLRENNFNVSLDIIGAGNLLETLMHEIDRMNLNSLVKIHGHLSNPHKITSQCDVFVLPSLAEGTPRAALEALFIGLPCILRQIDGSDELILDGINGFLFNTDDQLYSALVKAIQFQNNFEVRSLLPEFYSQKISSDKYLALCEN